MKMKIALLILVTTLPTVICYGQSSSSLTDNEKEIIIKEVRMTLDNYYNDIKKSGLLAEFTYLDNSSDFFWVPPGYSNSISYDSVSKILKYNAPKFKSIDNSFETLQIVPLSSELATYTGRIKSSMTDIGDKTDTFTLVETGVLIKRKDGWKLLSGQTTILN